MIGAMAYSDILPGQLRQVEPDHDQYIDKAGRTAGVVFCATVRYDTQQLWPYLHLPRNLFVGITFKTAELENSARGIEQA